MMGSMTKPLPPALLETLVLQGRWPGTDEEVRRQNLEGWVAGSRVTALASEETRIYFCRPPFATVQEEVDAGDTFYVRKMAAPEGLDPRRALIVGDFGLGSDSPIVLDYRDGLPPPRVMRLRWPEGGRGENNEWVQMAASFAEFVAKLGL